MNTKDVLHALGFLVGAGAALSACAKPTSPATEVPPASSPAAAVDAKWARIWTIAPGDMAEINLELDAGDTMAATFATDGAPLKWNVHSHEGHEAIIHAQGEDALGELRHDVAKGGMYSFLWLNEGPGPVRLTVKLGSGADNVHSTHPAD